MTKYKFQGSNSKFQIRNSKFQPYKKQGLMKYMRPEIWNLFLECNPYYFFAGVAAVAALLIWLVHSIEIADFSSLM